MITSCQHFRAGSVGCYSSLNRAPSAPISPFGKSEIVHNRRNSSKIVQAASCVQLGPELYHFICIFTATFTPNLAGEMRII